MAITKMYDVVYQIKRSIKRIAMNPSHLRYMLFSVLICVDDGWMCWQATTQTITWQKHELNTARIKSPSDLEQDWIYTRLMNIR
ncbi:hypothetical protein BCON_0262g00070 [Botryotinia convoluta]|uniref:Uncharacterized protein n=1 Tax=Botryotinia convoluta TaxID=54673 RepID=A0A4Z1HHB1_9HELO|nr:hypothetical protein BCON_0262g00070 [Botryotinia convoluta]